ncbi:histone-lysine n-methyltransferase h3 lysine-9 specific suvh1 [Anaeramoeba ignava]|uniref:Histone-lysine n-methyltransferase h3 lysine-9 specific suvh1 n=1 Tax=Anaeramoeba ignava TaxID=1746090 RepID=A0A9Q0LAL7_ANAIG|nr:histone-lysine n-methyltransferase h3 lysine-9 specific suvh1 [Anaeramoeba ignava]
MLLDFSNGIEKIPVLISQKDYKEIKQKSKFQYILNYVSSSKKIQLFNHLIQPQCWNQNNYDFGGKLIQMEKISHNLIQEPIIECHENQQCDCRNKVVQKGLKTKLQIFKTKSKGFGVKTLEKCEKGEFICEYCGEILTKKECEKRLKIPKESNYILTVLEFIGFSNSNQSENLGEFDPKLIVDWEEKVSEKKFPFIMRTNIDSEYKGNVSRFFNHSCFPNLSIFFIRFDYQIPHVGFFANRNIEPEEELCFDYGTFIHSLEKMGDCDSKVCFCGEECCRKFLPNFSNFFD